MLNTVLALLDKIQPVLKEGAIISDRNNSFPIKSFDLIKEEGLLNLIIPKSFGGLGLNFLEYQTCIAKLAEACPATAASLNMHCIVLGALTDVAYDKLTTEQKKLILPYVDELFSKVVNERKVFASATSEIGSGARYSRVKTNYQVMPDGYLINGRKSFVTMAAYADFYSIIAKELTVEGNTESGAQSLTFFIVPREQEGVKIIKDWDTLGMRGTQSFQVIFDNVFLPKTSAFLGITGFALTKIMQAPHWVTGGYLGVYLGIMKAALDFVIEYIKKRTDTATQEGLGYDTLVQAKIAELYQLYQTAYFATEQAAKKVLVDPHSKETHQLLYLAKYLVGENAANLTSLAIKTCGGMAIQKKFELERYLRDSFCAALMPVVSSACEVFIGRSLLDLPTDIIW